MIRFRKGGLDAGNNVKLATRDGPLLHLRPFAIALTDTAKTHVTCGLTAAAGSSAAVSASATAPARSSGPAQTQQSAGGATGPQVIVLPTIDDLHLPRRYQRRPIDSREIEYINVSPRYPSISRSRSRHGV